MIPLEITFKVTLYAGVELVVKLSATRWQQNHTFKSVHRSAFTSLEDTVCSSPIPPVKIKYSLCFPLFFFYPTSIKETVNKLYYYQRFNWDI